VGGKEVKRRKNRWQRENEGKKDRGKTRHGRKHGTRKWKRRKTYKRSKNAGENNMECTEKRERAGSWGKRRGVSKGFESERRERRRRTRRR